MALTIYSKAGADAKFATLANASVKPSATDALIWVAPSGSDSTGDGRSHGSAFRTLTAAVAALPASLSAPATIRLAPGAYTEPGTINLGQRRNLTIIGSGMGVTQLTFSGTGSSIVSAWPVNSPSIVTHLTIADLSIANANGSNVGAGFEQRAGTEVYVTRVNISGHKYGIVFDQTELAHIDQCDLQMQITAGIWFTRGPDWTASAQITPPFTNNVTVSRCQIHEPSTAIGIIDDGGWAHTIENNSFDGCSNQVIIAGMSGGTISGNECENAVDHYIVVTNVSHLLGTAVGPSVGLLIAGNVIDTASTGKAAIMLQSGMTITILSNSLSSTGYAIRGASTVNTLTSVGNFNGGTGALLYETRATNHVALDKAELALLGPAFKTALTYAPPASGTAVFLDLGNGTKDTGGTVPAYGIGRGDTSLINSVDYRTAAASKHRFLVDGTEIFKVTANGAFAMGKAIGLASMTTAQRNTLGAATVGAGGAVWDNSLGKPVYSDGTNWRDSAATIV